MKIVFIVFNNQHNVFSTNVLLKIDVKIKNFIEIFIKNYTIIFNFHFFSAFYLLDLKFNFQYIFGI